MLSDYNYRYILVLLGVVLVLLIGTLLLWPKTAQTSSQELECDSSCFLEATYIPYINGEVIIAEVTAYNPTEEQCGSNPTIMASGSEVYSGAVACPSWIEFGTVVKIDDIMYICEDRTSKRYNGRFDILMFSYEEAIAWGIRKKEVTIYN